MINSLVKLEADKSKSGWNLLILKIRLTETGHIKIVLFSFSSSWNHDEEIILVKDNFKVKLNFIKKERYLKISA